MIKWKNKQATSFCIHFILKKIQNLVQKIFIHEKVKKNHWGQKEFLARFFSELFSLMPLIDFN